MIGFEDDLVVVFSFNEVEDRVADLGEGSGLLHLVMNTLNLRPM